MKQALQLATVYDRTSPFLDFVMRLRLNRLLSSLSASALFLTSLPSQAAGFDCAKATSPTEKAICADGKLSKLDSDLSTAWKNASDVALDPAALKLSQVRWLKLRDACGADTSCLSARYSERLSALASAQSAVETDRAGNRLEALVAENPGQSPDADEKRCTVDKRLCMQIVREDADAVPVIQIDSAGSNASTERFALSDIPSTSQDIDVTLWPRILRLAGDQGAIVVGAEVNATASYSGGGGSASELRLYEIGGDRTTAHDHAVLSVPLTGSLLIRACFSEKDQRHRLDACHDEYEFSATLRLNRAVKSGFPQLVYQTLATSFPGKVSRDKDSLEGPPLRKRDLVTVVDTQCTYKRIFHFEDKPGVYTPDQPLPDCDNYTVP